jgi:VIT1/CCC1 family predicted Fe2+/Mn2+ transporter
MRVIDHILNNKRYIGLGTIDGILTTIGTALTAYAMGLDPLVVGTAAAGGALALGMTNTFGSYVGEVAEGGSYNHEVLADMVTHGGTTVLGAAVPLIPLFILPSGIGIIGSLLTSLFSLIILGRYLGKESGRGVPITIMELIIVGALISAVTFTLGGH